MSDFYNRLFQVSHRRGVACCNLPAGIVAAISILLVGSARAADSTTPRSTPQAISSETGSSTDQVLLARGLLYPAPASSIQPAAGAEVDEYVQLDSHSGEELARFKLWQEGVNGRDLEIQQIQYPAGQKALAFWLMQPGDASCVLFGTRTYNSTGEEINSSIWRNDPGLKIPDAADFPPDLFPGWVPPTAFLRAVDHGARRTDGAIHVQITPYGFATLDVWTKGQVDLALLGKNFRAVKVVTRTNIRSFLPSWPRLVLRILQPLLHESTFYFEADAPNRFLKGEGPGSVGGPEIETELVHYYTVGASNTSDVKVHQ